MPVYFVESNRWKEIVTAWTRKSIVFAPFHFNSHILYERVSENNIEDAIFGYVRPLQPLKFFFYPFQERTVPEIENPEKRIIIGAANCDLAGT